MKPSLPYQPLLLAVSPKLQLLPRQAQRDAVLPGDGGQGVGGGAGGSGCINGMSTSVSASFTPKTSLPESSAPAVFPAVLSELSEQLMINMAKTAVNPMRFNTLIAFNM